MDKTIRTIALGCGVVFAAACGTDTTSAEVNISGTWTTTVGSCVFGNPAPQCTMTMLLTQSGTTITGTGSLSHATLGTIGTMSITGSITSSSAVSLSLSGNAFDADPDDTVQYVGTASGATTITGTFTSAGSITGAFTFKKQ